MGRFSRCLAIALATFFIAFPVAADIYTPGADPYESFAEAIDSDALFRAPATIDQTARLVSTTNDESSTGQQRITNGIRSLKAIKDYAQQQLNPQIPLEKDLLDSIESVRGQLIGLIPSNALIRPTNWQIDPNEFRVNLIPNVRVLDFQTTYLDTVSSDPVSYRNAIDTLGILKLTHQTLNYIKRKAALQSLKTVVDERHARWQVYFDKGIPQWPWELALVNGPIYGRSIRKEKGLGKVPEWQLIVAHPDIALEYVDSAEDGDQLKPALLIEVLGANFWSWENGAKQKGPWGLPTPLGAGIVATFTDRAGSDDWGLGGILHINHVYNIGTTFRDGDTGVFVSVNLAKLFEDNRKKAERFRKMYGL